jgi:thiamine-phosphate pyrophosphorylase
MRLWAIADGSNVAAAEAACRAGGSDVVIHLRDKQRGGKELLAAAERLRTITQAHGSKLVLGCAYEIALRVRVDGFHGWRSPGKMGRWLFSAPAHDAEEVRRAVDRKADAVLVSPIFETPGKGSPRGIEAIREARALAPDAKIYALGGIDEGNARACIDAGADGVAVIRAIFSAPDPAAATVALLRAMG